MICNGKTLNRRKAGRYVLVASKVFARIWRDEGLRKAFTDLCVALGNDAVECYECGPLIVRNVLTSIMRMDGPVAKALRIASVRRLRSEEYDILCREIVSGYGVIPSGEAPKARPAVTPPVTRLPRNDPVPTLLHVFPRLPPRSDIIVTGFHIPSRTFLGKRTGEGSGRQGR